jgi:TetR/AcrR family transcriptional repressor of nem operon
MPSKPDQKARTHATILDSAARLLRARGIGGARVADVMAGAGLTVGGFYAHFASKEALIDDVLRRTAARLRARLFADLDANPTRGAGIVLDRYVSRTHRDDLERGCPFPAVVGEIATTAHAHRDVLAEQVEALVRELGAHVPRGAQRSRRRVALGLFALMYGGLGLARALRGTALSDEVIAACRAFGHTALRAHEDRRSGMVPGGEEAMGR